MGSSKFSTKKLWKRDKAMNGSGEQFTYLQLTPQRATALKIS